jgi:hypothetical protein
MKKILLFLLALTPLAAFAQLSGSGYYRVQNDVTKRYISIVDTRAEVTTNGIDLRALHMLKPFEDSVAYNPASICYVDLVSSSQCNLTGQGLNLHDQVGRYLNYIERSGGCYWLYGQINSSGVSVTKYLGDESYEDFGPEYIVYHPNDDGANRDWWVYPVTQEESQYFGVKPDVTASVDGSYWATMYAGFPFKPSAESTKVYYVSKVDYNFGVAVIKEITGDVPSETPVLFRCAGATPSQNKLTLLDPSTTNNIGTNYLIGNYYCNDVAESTGHRNVRTYSNSSMRMLGTTADGKPAFVKSNIKYVPANKCYLAVSSKAPDELLIMTEEEYVTGIEEINFNGNVTGNGKVYYDLQGRRVQAPGKGLYIVNGKKVVIK